MRSEIKIGLLGIAALLILIYGYKFLKGQNILESANTYYIQYEDVAQLSVSDGVFINGFKVGSVVDMSVNRENANLIDVTINIEGDLPLPQNTKAVLAPNGVMGQKLINLEFDKICTENCIPNKGTIRAGSQGLLSSMFGEPTELEAYFESIKKNIDEDVEIKKSLTNVEQTIANLNKVTQQLDHLLTSSNASLQNVFRNLDKVTAEVAKNKEDLSSAINNLSSFSKKLNDTNIDGLMENVNSTVSSADVTIKKLESTLETTNESLKNVKGLLNGLEEGKGTMGRLLKEETLAENLDRVTKNLDLLLQDIRLNPKRYINVSVFGKKQKEYEKPEDDPAFE